LKKHQEHPEEDQTLHCSAEAKQKSLWLKNHQEHAEEDQTLMLCQSKTRVIIVTENHPEEHAEEELLLLWESSCMSHYGDDGTTDGEEGIITNPCLPMEGRRRSWWRG
jgi:hypothetical protein